ncbi:DNA-binding response regulator, NarL/FixJ family, contains REC and HTH domains [Actinokineospora alba]|uniref:DNA-binding response regulator, NarL/FixJ family, contains REC and HTH domains n=1 Tax=Actinokineospora alba TaxID=504798 RepID=A0A1H0N1D3_9PSEU|nr:response regulator transcription factor [Actinokineospora alba]TDP68523.1 LuxR family two component transcriptional regulator [Actinokineospora alba]SDH80897.1 DNA-binding response regulator, NarL/FixJ family, contains REC and HTH domains [Actinokineospora alba]SDO86539.1 DNA-binding response regulator, NarL/FixJ family, contains REC and HTH domains [Actinokineospora alba]
MSDARPRVLVVDDHPLFRFGLCTVLAAEPSVELVGEAATGAEAIATARELTPDVVVMDVHLPDMTGIDAARAIVGERIDTGVLVLTMFNDSESVFAAMRAGARGYLLKGSGQDEIVRAVHAVGRGEAIFGPDIATRVLGFFNAGPELAGPVFPELTAREREVLALIANGVSNPGIASKLSLSPKTVRNHVSSIFTKLHVADRAQAIVRARKAGLGDGG